MAGLMLAGSAFSTASATKITKDQFLGAINESTKVLDVNSLKLSDNAIELSEDIELKVTADSNTPGQYVIINTPNITLTSLEAGKPVTLTGRVIVAANGVTISGMKLNNTVQLGTGGGVQGGFWNNTALTIFADDATVTNNEITGSIAEGNTNNCINGIKIYPQTENTSYTIKGNTLKGFATLIGNQWYSSAFQVYEGAAVISDESGESIPAALANLKGIGDNVSATIKGGFNAAAIQGDNTFVGNDADIVVRSGRETDTQNYKTTAAVITMPKDATKAEAQKVALTEAITKATEDASISFGGSAEELAKLLEGVTLTGANVAVACSDVNILYGDAENPNNGKDAVINGIAPAVKEVYGYNLIENPGNPSEYAMLILTAGENQFVVYQEGADSKIKQVTSASVLEEYETNPASLWKMTSGKNADGSLWYKFENQEGKLLKATGGNNATDGIFFAKNKVAYSENGVVLSNIADDNEYSYGLYNAGYNKLSVEDLKWFEKDGFSVTIKYKNDKGEFKKEDIAGNPFAGHLALMNWNGSKFVEAESESTDNLDYDFYLMNADGNFIVAEKYIFNGASKDQEAYTFTTVTAKALAHDIIANKDKREYYGEFQAEVSAKYKQDTYHGLKVIDLLSVKIGNGWAPVGRLDLGTKEVPTLAASIDTKLFDIQVNLGSNKVVDPQKFVQAKFFTVTKLGKDGGMLAVAGDKYEGADYYDCEFVSACGNDLEKQFALTYRSGDGKFVFTNRETLNYRWTIDANRLYYGEKDNEYVYGGDTYLIETVENHEAKDGYSQLSDVKNTKFHIAYSSGIFGNAWFTENHQGVDNHTIGLSTDKETALVFTATEYAKERAIKHDEDAHTNKYVPTDSIYVISKLGFYDKDAKKFDSKDDTLKVVSYSFVNQYGEPLIWNGNRYVSSTEKSVAADKFALRKDNGKLNLRPVVGEWDSQGKHYTSWISAGDNESYLTHQYFGTTNKAYAGDADEEGILSQTWMYNRTENDLFTVEPTEKPMYRTVINPLDTISIFRNDNPKSILFEDKGFLGMENLAQYPSIAPAMVADTAYVRDNTYRPQYMLVVNPDITPAGMWCEEHQSATCEHAVPTKGWVEGRYLVNLVDTAIVWDIANKHKDNNPYINTEKFYRLGFVQAKHIEDSLIIASTNDTLMVGTEDYNQAKFAFRYVDTDAKSLRIETANYKRLPGVKEAEVNEENELGYVKWMNGVVVVVDKIEDGDVFNMNEDEQGDPTANDAIATEGVSVIATEGAVIVKGAAGKNVVITNVLGQTIANTVITSSEAQISAPAGIVVVAVEGEAAVKAIVK